MSKYEPLGQHLINLSPATERWRTTFREIERILGFPLPASARRYPAWWANDQSHPQKMEWLASGWRTEELDLAGERVTFCRDEAAKTKLRSKKSKAQSRHLQTGTPDRNAPWPWDEAKDFDCSVRFSWQPTGRVQLDHKDKLLFPSVSPEPGVYRLRLKLGPLIRDYIGESANLSRRFGNYRQGNEGQRTSHRIHKELHKALKEGTQISVAVMKVGALRGGRSTAESPCDLSSKAARCFLENLALVLSRTDDTELLNR